MTTARQEFKKVSEGINVECPTENGEESVFVPGNIQIFSFKLLKDNEKCFYMRLDLAHD